MSVRKPERGSFERRTIVAQELRASGTEQDPVIEGYAALFESLSVEMWGFREKIRAGAFRESIEKHDIRALFNHDPNYVLGRTAPQTLELREDDKGLFMRAYPPRTQWAQDLYESIRRGDVTQQSFSFRTLEDEWSEEQDGQLIRTLVKVRLYDVGPVTFPAYEDTDVAARALDGLEVSVEQFADAFRRARSGGTLDPDARSILESVSRALAMLGVTPAAGSQARGTTEPVAADDYLAILRRRLALAAV